MAAAPGAPVEVSADGDGLFRRQLAVQIFPQAFRDLGTIHPRHFLVQGVRPPRRRSRLVNSPVRPEVPPGMTSRARTATWLILLGFVAFLLWSTLSAQRSECSVEVEYLGRSGTGTASANSEQDAAREAQTAACGPITNSMNDRIACAKVPPVSRRCRAL
jgi:hypothetical protein